MSLPPFLFSSAAPTSARSAFASTTANAGTGNEKAIAGTGGIDLGAGVGAEANFRQAFMQAAQTKPSAELKAVPVDGKDGDSLIAKLNLLFESDALPEELQASLQSVIDDMQNGVLPEHGGSIEAIVEHLHHAELPEEQLELTIAALEGVVAEMSLNRQQPVEVVAELQELVEFLTTGKTLPLNPSADVRNLSDSDVNVDAEVPAVIPYITNSMQSAVLPTEDGGVVWADAPDVLLTEQAKPLNSVQWQLDSEDEKANGPLLKPDLLNGSGSIKTAAVAADFVVKPESAASPLTAILSADVELPESLNQQALAPLTSAGKPGAPLGLQAPADPQLNAAMRVQVAFGHSQWSEALAERTAWLAGQQIHSAELQLDPPELGPLQVRISVHQDQAVVNFVSANPQVRDALDQSMVRLREMLQEQGMQLVDAGVSDQRGGKGETAGGEGADGLISNGAGEDSAEQTSALGEVMDTRYGVDDFV